MFCRNITWFIFIFLAAATATDYDDTDYSAGSDLEVTVNDLSTDSSESSPMEPDSAVKQALATDLPSLLDAGEGAIVTLVAGDTRLLAHKAVLAARSAVFAAIFGHDTQEARSGQVTFADMEGPVLRELVGYLYTLQAPQLASMAPRLLVAADRYGVPGLKALCEQHVAAHLSVETAAGAALLAVRHSCKSLGQAAAAFIKAHVFHVMATQGWADAMRRQPDDLIEVIQLLAEPSAEASAPAAADSGAAPTTAQPRSDRCGRSHTPVADGAAAAPQNTAQPDDAAISLLRNLSAEEKGSRLIEAAKEGAVGVVQALLAAGADVAASDEAGSTALHWAAWHGHVEVARRLLQAGAPVMARNHFRNTPLHWAAWYGHTAVVRLLAAASADPNARNRNGTTPLHLAAEHDRPAVAAALLEKGADTEARNNRGQTPLDVARQYSRHQLVDLLT